MEDLATDRIYRLMIAQRIRHHDEVNLTGEDGRPVRHTPEFVSELFDEELTRILRELPADAPPEVIEKYRTARRVSEEMISRGEFDPI
jgi:malate synthase